MKSKYFLLVGYYIIITFGVVFSQSNPKTERVNKIERLEKRTYKNSKIKSSISLEEIKYISEKIKSATIKNTSKINSNTIVGSPQLLIDKEPIKLNKRIIENRIVKRSPKKTLIRNTDTYKPISVKGRSLNKTADVSLEDGDEWIAVMDYLEDNRSLFLTKPSISDLELDIKQISATQILESGSPITVPSNGSGIIFVDEENNIKLINTDGTDEKIISSSPAWYSVSISPDGSKLALIPNNIEPYIYISDLANPDNSSTIRIYNPLSVDTINDTTLQFADVLTWSADGENIYYDCLVAEADGNEYWTINLLNVNNGDNTQLFELEDSMQVWGPSASNNGDYLLLDLYDSKTDSITILLVDFNQDLPGIIEENGTSISNSRFSPLDDMVVFERFDSLNGTIVPILTKITLSEDKRIPASPSEQFIDSFRYPVWFVIGGIPVSVEMDETKSVPTRFNLSQNYPNPFNPTTTINYTIPAEVKGNFSSLQNVELKIYDVLGNEVTTLVNEVQSTGNYMVNFDGSRLSSGIYYYQLKAGQFRESKKMLLLK